MNTCCCSLAGTDACKNCNAKSQNLIPSLWTLLQQQIPPQNKERLKPVIQYWCPKCDALLSKYQKYCHNCASPLDWADI